jgi:hypothetical protein
MSMRWQDATRLLRLSLDPGSRMLSPSPRTFEVRVAGSQETRRVEFSGKPVTLKV